MARKKSAAPERLRAMVLIVLFGASLLMFLSLGQYFAERGGFLYDDTGNHFRIGFGRQNLPEAVARLEDYLKNSLMEKPILE